jgi:hypothetical protein
MDSMNARARVYYGKKRIPYGKSVGGNGMWSGIDDCFWSDEEEKTILDDHVLIFHTKHLDALMSYNPFEFHDIHGQHEWMHNTFYDRINIKKNVIGINMIFRRKEGDFAYSGNIHC